MSPTLARRMPDPVIPWTCPYRVTPADVVTVNMVLTGAPFGVTIDGLEVQVIAMRTGHQTMPGSPNHLFVVT